MPAMYPAKAEVKLINRSEMRTEISGLNRPCMQTQHFLFGGLMFEKPYEVGDCGEWQAPPVQMDELPPGLIGDEI